MRNLLVAIALTLPACSLYQSPGRKFLEKEGFEFAGVSAQANKSGCQSGSFDQSHWVLLTNSGLARVYASESGPYDLKVLPAMDNPGGFHCDFRFPSAADMYRKIPAAIDLTMAEMHEP